MNSYPMSMADLVALNDAFTTIQRLDNATTMDYRNRAVDHEREVMHAACRGTQGFKLPPESRLQYVNDRATSLGCPALLTLSLIHI